MEGKYQSGGSGWRRSVVAFQKAGWDAVCVVVDRGAAAPLTRCRENRGGLPCNYSPSDLPQRVPISIKRAHN